MAQGLPRTIAAVLVAAGVVHCSLIAPSDQELMGGNKGDGGNGSGGDGGDGGRSDAMDGSGGVDGACGQQGDCCNTTANCCSGLACNQNTGICLPCTPNGGGCSGGFDMCCSGNCVGHTCR